MRHAASVCDERRWIWVLVMATALAVLAPIAAPASAADGDFGIRVVSSPPEYISGGDASVVIAVPSGTSPVDVTVTIGGVDVTDQLDVAGQRRLTGVITGIPEGATDIVAAAPGAAASSLPVVNHSVAGPMFSGPHQEPFYCETVLAGLGPALDEDCFAPTKVEIVYRSTAGGFRPMPTDARPADLARTTTLAGRTVDYIVRLETGVINRAVYQTAILFDPRRPDLSRPAATGGWNHRLVYTFGGGCNAGFHQGRGNGGVLSDLHLGLGYAVASSSLNVLNNNCNDVLSAETALMVKEHFIETYGEPEHTIGWGGSGGAIQQHLIAHNYPGILDGIIPTASFPDVHSIFPGMTDCRLLFNYFPGAPAGMWTPAAQNAAVGYAGWNNCLAWEGSFANRSDPDAGCDPSIPPAVIYHPVDNPDGVRCTVQDHLVNIFGIDPATGFVPTLDDNRGVQYGLAAFQGGDLTAAQFVDLNAGIGGFDFDGNVVATRSSSGVGAVETAYQTGRVVTGSGLAAVPILDARPYLDTFGDIHDRFRSFSIRHRLVRDNGHADNHVIWVVPATAPAVQAQMTRLALLSMDEWLTALDPRGDRPTAAEVVAARPASLVDSCWAQDGTRIMEPASFDGATACNALFPSHHDPRVESGAPVTNDNLKCSLRPLNPADYPVALTADQWSTLQATFPDGVCDWGAPGIGRIPWAGPWQSFGN